MLRGPEPDGRVEHQRLLPHGALAEVVAHFWSIRWDLRAPFVAQTLPHPTTHVVFEAEATVSGPTSKRFTRTLSGKGEVLGVKFRPAMFSSVCARPASALAERVLPLAEVLPSAASWAADVARARSLDAKLRVCEAALERLVQPVPPLVETLRDLTEAIEHDRTLVRVAELARRAHLQPRTLERSFRRHVGKSPKWVLRRYRLIDAAERLATGDGASIADIAQDVGYYDQAHFARDFRALVGVAPSALRRRVASPSKELVGPPRAP